MLYVCTLDCCAIDFHNNKLPSAVTDYHNNDDSEYFYILPVLTLFFDLVTVLSYCYVLYMCCRLKSLIDNVLLDLTVLISIFSVMSTTVNHLPYILIAVINSPLYATGILIYYALFVAVYVLSVNIIIASTLRHYNNKISEKSQWCKICFIAGRVILICIVSVILVSLTAIIIVFNVYIPIKNSIADVPLQIQSLFHFTAAFFVGLITYKVLQKPNSVQKVELVNLENTDN